MAYLYEDADGRLYKRERFSPRWVQVDDDDTREARSDDQDEAAPVWAWRDGDVERRTGRPA